MNVSIDILSFLNSIIHNGWPVRARTEVMLSTGPRWGAFCTLRTELVGQAVASSNQVTLSSSFSSEYTKIALIQDVRLL